MSLPTTLTFWTVLFHLIAFLIYLISEKERLASSIHDNWVTVAGTVAISILVTVIFKTLKNLMNKHQKAYGIQKNERYECEMICGLIGVIGVSIVARICEIQVEQDTFLTTFPLSFFILYLLTAFYFIFIFPADRHHTNFDFSQITILSFIGLLGLLTLQITILQYTRVTVPQIVLTVVGMAGTVDLHLVLCGIRTFEKEEKSTVVVLESIMVVDQWRSEKRNIDFPKAPFDLHKYY